MLKYLCESVNMKLIYFVMFMLNLFEYDLKPKLEDLHKTCKAYFAYPIWNQKLPWVSHVASDYCLRCLEAGQFLIKQ